MGSSSLMLAREQDGAGDAGAAPRLVLYRGSWAIYQNRSRVSCGTADRPTAEAFLTAYRQAARPKSAPVGSHVTSLLQTYLSNRRARGKPGAERLFWAHKALSRHLGDRVPRELSDDDFVQYAAVRVAEGVKPSTARTELQALRAALRWHLGNDAPAVSMPQRAQPRDRWLTRAEARQLLAACERRHISTFIMLGLHTAARSKAILELTWDRVNLDTKRIDYRVPGQPLTRKRVVPVPINDTLHACLLDARAKAETQWVVEWAGSRVLRIKNGMKRTADRAGLAGVTPHVLRHTAATWMAQAGVPLWQVAGFIGHSDAVMVAQVYGHHSPDHLAEAASALSR